MSKGHSEGTSANAAVVFLDVSSYYCPSSWWACIPPVFVSIITSEMKFPLLWSLSVIILTVCRSRTKVSRVSLHFTDFSTLSWNTHSRQHRHPSDSRDESETRSFSCHQQGDQAYSVTNSSFCVCLCPVVASDAFLEMFHSHSCTEESPWCFASNSISCITFALIVKCCPVGTRERVTYGDRETTEGKKTTSLFVTPACLWQNNNIAL